MKQFRCAIAAFFVLVSIWPDSALESTNAPPSTNPPPATSLKRPATNSIPLVWFDLLENHTNKCVIRLADGKRFDVVIPDAPKTLYADQKDFSQEDALVALDKLRLERWKFRLDHLRRKPAAELAQYEAQMAEHQRYTTWLNSQKQKSVLPYHHIGHYQGYRVGRTNDLPEWRIVR